MINNDYCYNDINNHLYNNNINNYNNNNNKPSSKIYINNSDRSGNNRSRIKTPKNKQQDDD